MSAGKPVAVVKDMAVTHQEFARAFARLLPAHASDWDPAKDGPTRRFPWGGGVVEVRLGPESERRIAMIVLPRTSVTLRCEGMTSDERRSFLAAFDRRFQRGGG